MTSDGGGEYTSLQYCHILTFGGYDTWRLEIACKERHTPPHLQSAKKKPSPTMHAAKKANRLQAYNFEFQPPPRRVPNKPSLPNPSNRRRRKLKNQSKILWYPPSHFPCSKTPSSSLIGAIQFPFLRLRQTPGQRAFQRKQQIMPGPVRWRSRGGYK